MHIHSVITRLHLSRYTALSLMLVSLPLAACREETQTVAAAPRPVRTMTIEKSELGEEISLTGHLQAENEATLAFRIGGRIIERSVNVGDHVTVDQVMAKLDSQNELNSMRSAQANLTAAQGRLKEAGNNFSRQQSLLERGFTTRVLFDQAQQVYNTALSQVDDARAQLKIAEDRLSYTELKADAAGAIIARGAEAGEVVQAGQMIFKLARQGGWDAVFNVPAQTLRAAPSDPKIIVSLTDDPTVTATARVRQVDPQADPVTRTFRVKVSVDDPPPAMRLGATVVGRMQLESSPGIAIPAAALTEIDRQPSVWIVDPATETVSMRRIGVVRFDPGTVVVSDGLAPGDIVVTAGVQALHPGQKVRLLGSST
ncbi:efflux RND transporter periplasmic adaptor subunit [Beijerinckia indica]|uniref:Efflux transporter, RND family, MFP subunit n=1 Tax=Beijerinckia indica subsp. indica (strain ATCC 9039 / DSM 1715 / NCIMB 8712) TaxID=395963 RepID=B2IKA0_BEII9|nr:efflux RND transporter periplasmic adaptor subunit [Beijerinckia indica]ACB95032.1 efflux transporter, RND family, MFP subunit [Beijerinckia indica subsp. indica ATCC 9039]